VLGIPSAERMSSQNSQLKQRLSNQRDLSSDKPIDTESTSSSSWYNDISGLFSGSKNKNEESERDDEDEAEKESMICTTLRTIRIKYLERQLVGKIYIRRVFGLISTAVSSDVTSEDIANHLLKKHEDNNGYENDPLVQAELTGQYWRAITTVDTILNSLERRSLSYSTADFGSSTVLSRGATIGVNDPFFHIFGFSFTLELSATARSLIASRKKYEAIREIAQSKKKKEDSESGIRLQMNPFSFFENGKKEEETNSAEKGNKKV
jgi:hypothetical protein